MLAVLVINSSSMQIKDAIKIYEYYNISSLYTISAFKYNVVQQKILNIKYVTLSWGISFCYSWIIKQNDIGG